jgi:flagellar hook-basal body complex protein FliE
MKYLFSFILFFCSFLSLFAQEDVGYGFYLNQRTKVFKTPYRLHPEEALKALKDNQWVQNEGRSSYGLSKDFFWVSIPISDIKKPGKNYLIELNSPHVDSAALYWVSDSKPILIAEIGDRIPFSKRPIIHPKLLFPLPKDDNTGEYLLKLDKRGGSANFPLYLWETKSFEYSDTKEMLFWYVFMGVFLFFILLSIIVDFLFKNKLFRYYSFFTFIILCYNFITSGFSFAYIYPENVWINDKLRFLILPLFGISYVWFTKQYFEIYSGYPVFKRIGNLMTLIFFVLIFIGLFFSNLFSAYALSITGVMYATLIATASWSILIIFQVRHRLKNRSLFFLIAFSGYILVLIFNVLVEFGLIEKSIFRFNPIFIANIQEILVMTVGMYFYLNKINEERNYLKTEKNKLNDSEIQFKEQLKQFFTQMENQQSISHQKKGGFPINPYLLKDKTMIDLSKVLFIEAMDHYLIFHFSDKKVMDRKSIKEFITSTPGENFVQIHKSYIVNKFFISTIEANRIILENGQILPLSRTYKTKVKNLNF